MTTNTTTDTHVFPHPILTPIPGKPTYESLALLKQELLANARSVASDGGDGLLGLAQIILGSVEYARVSTGNVDFDVPAKPAAVDIAAQGSAVALAKANATYKAALLVWKEYHHITKKLLQQILDAVKDTYTKALKDTTWGYSNVTPYNLITHLFTTYGKITANDLLANRAKMLTPWAPPADIEDLFANLDNCRAYAVAGNDPISERNAVDAGVAVIQATGLFPPAIRDWNKKLPQDRDWPTFKAHFREAEEERQTNTTANAAGYNRANAITSILAAKAANADASLAPTTTSSLSNPTLADVNTLASLLIQQMANATTSTNRPRPPPTVNTAPITAAERTTMGYCHTHGFCHNPNHTSATCIWPGPNHQREATATNTMGGTTIRYQPRSRANTNNNNNN